jgi:hypothetical protein
MAHTRYVAHRRRPNGVLHKTNHGAEFRDVTLCGADITPEWFVALNQNHSPVTCAKCLKAFAKTAV